MLEVTEMNILENERFAQKGKEIGFRPASWHAR
jgi:hypothetical protein